MKKACMLYFLFAIILIISCRTNMELVPTRMRTVLPEEVSSYHSPVQMTIAWHPYQELNLVKKSDEKWIVTRSDSADTGVMPIILVTYPDTKDSIWLDMTTDNKLLGKLIKHSLMTQEPIKRPIGNYFEIASCSKCHPPDVKVKFE